MSGNFDVFNSRDEIYLVFTEKKQIFFLFYTLNLKKVVPHQSLVTFDIGEF